MIRHGRTTSIGPFRIDDARPGDYKEKPISHIDVMKKMVYRLQGELDNETRARLGSVIATYTRIYGNG